MPLPLPPGGTSSPQAHCEAPEAAGQQAHIPVQTPVDLPAAPAQEQHAGQHHECAPHEEGHHHHHQHIVVQDGVGLCLGGAGGRVQVLLWALVAPTHGSSLPNPNTHCWVVCGVVPCSGQGDRGGGGGTSGRGGRGLHFEVRRRGLGAAGLAQHQLPSPCPLPHLQESRREPPGAVTHKNSPHPLRSAPRGDLHLPIF